MLKVKPLKKCPMLLYALMLKIHKFLSSESGKRAQTEDRKLT